MTFKLHGKPPMNGLNLWFMLFSMSLSFEFVLTMVYLLHILNPISSIWNIGFAFLFILPGLDTYCTCLGFTWHFDWFTHNAKILFKHECYNDHAKLPVDSDCTLVGA